MLPITPKTRKMIENRRSVGKQVIRAAHASSKHGWFPMCFLITQISTNRILVRFDPFSQTFFRFFKIAKQKWRTRSMPHRIVLRLVLLLFPFRFFVLIFLVDIAGYCWAFLAKKKRYTPKEADDISEKKINDCGLATESDPNCSRWSKDKRVLDSPPLSLTFPHFSVET